MTTNFFILLRHLSGHWYNQKYCFGAYYIDGYKFINSSDFIFFLFNNSADAFKFPRKKSSLSFFRLYCNTSLFSWQFTSPTIIKCWSYPMTWKKKKKTLTRGIKKNVKRNQITLKCQPIWNLSKCNKSKRQKVFHSSLKLPYFQGWH